jgi:hypothetical protein
MMVTSFQTVFQCEVCKAILADPIGDCSTHMQDVIDAPILNAKQAGELCSDVLLSSAKAIELTRILTEREQYRRRLAEIYVGTRQGEIWDNYALNKIAQVVLPLTADEIERINRLDTIELPCLGHKLVAKP